MGSARRELRPLSSHSSTVWSAPAVARVCPSGANATAVTELVWPVSGSTPARGGPATVPALEDRQVGAVDLALDSHLVARVLRDARRAPALHSRDVELGKKPSCRWHSASLARRRQPPVPAVAGCPSNELLSAAARR